MAMDGRAFLRTYPHAVKQDAPNAQDRYFPDRYAGRERKPKDKPHKLDDGGWNVS